MKKTATQYGVQVFTTQWVLYSTFLDGDYGKARARLEEMRAKEPTYEWRIVSRELPDSMTSMMERARIPFTELIPLEST